MKKMLMALVFPSVALSEPVLVYDPPKVYKFEVPFYVGKYLREDYSLRAGFDWRAGYPFLAGIFYERRKREESAGIRAKVRLSLVRRLKNDFSIGALYGLYGRKVTFLVGLEQILFVRGSFSFRILEGYVFDEEEGRWLISVGFGF